MPSTCCWESVPENRLARIVSKNTLESNTVALPEVTHDDRVHERHQVADQQADQLGDLRAFDVDEAGEHEGDEGEEADDHQERNDHACELNGGHQVTFHGLNALSITGSRSPQLPLN